VNLLFGFVDRLMHLTSPATATTRRADCNGGGPPPFAASHVDHVLIFQVTIHPKSYANQAGQSKPSVEQGSFAQSENRQSNDCDNSQPISHLEV